MSPTNTSTTSTTSASSAASKSANGSGNLSQIVTFRLGADLFAADIHGVERVLRWQQPTPIPNVPAWIVGVLDYQKRVLPVIDLRTRFELAVTAPTAETRVVVFNAGENWVAGVVDAVLDVAALGKATVEPPPPLFRGLSADYLRGIIRRDGKLVLLLDTERLLSATERLALSAATEALSHA
jgi:purine-binding chemotaxis protein CheW